MMMCEQKKTKRLEQMIKPIDVARVFLIKIILMIIFNRQMKEEKGKKTTVKIRQDKN